MSVTGPAERLDLRLLIPAGVAWALAVWALSWPVAVRGVMAAGALVAGLAALSRSRRATGGVRPRCHQFRLLDPGRWALLALVATAVGATLAASTAASLGRSAGGIDTLVAERAAVTAEGVVLTEPVTRRRGSGGETMVVLRVRLTEVTARGWLRRTRAPVLVVADESWAGLRWHDRVALSGRLAPASPGDAMVGRLSPRGPPRAVAGRSVPLRAAEHMRSGLRAATDPLPRDARALVPALVIGDTSRTPEDLTDDMLVTGMSHLSAVSGSNVAIVLAAAIGAARVVGVPRRARPWLALAVLAWFVVLARPEPSVIRAATMGAIGLLGLSASRRSSGIPVLSGAVLVLLVVDPWLARSYGFALSTLATLGLLVFVRPWSRAINRRLPSWAHVVGPAVAIPVAAHLMCAPVVVLLQGSVSVVGVLANLVAAPLVAPTTIAGVASALVALVSVTAATWVAWLAALPAVGIGAIARYCADVPGGTLPWPDGQPGAWLLAALSLLVVLTGPWLCRWASAVPVVALGLSLVLVASALPTRAWTWPPKGWRLVVCDVGQGDAIVIATGPGRAVLVDTGPEPGPVDRCLRDLGVRTLDAVVLTHLHADHVDGLVGAIDGRRVDRLLLGPAPASREHHSGDAALQRARDSGIAVQTLVADDSMRFGDVSARVWWPRRQLGGASPVNNGSVVLGVDVGPVRALLLGDVEREAGRAMLLALRRDPELARWARDIDVVKAPHHGSANLDEDFMTAVAAPVAVISVGADNDYGHPSGKALAVLRRGGSRVWRTDEDGAVAVVDLGGRVAVVSLR